MVTFLAGLLAIALGFMPPATLPTEPSGGGYPLGAIPGLQELFAGDPPELGVKNGQLSLCPESPNCWVSQGNDQTHTIDPIQYSRSRADARDLLVKVLEVVPRTQVVAQTNDYVRAEATSRLFGFVDDLEFYFPEADTVVHMRSAARLGESDLGVNRRRLEQIRLALQDLGI